MNTLERFLVDKIKTLKKLTVNHNTQFPGLKTGTNY